MRARTAALLAACALAACGEPVTPPSPPAAPAQLSAPIPAAGRPPARPAARRALWVLCEGSQRVLEHPDRVPALLEDARRLGASDLFVQVYRGGRAWFDSPHADAAPYRAMLEAQGSDPLERLLGAAHAQGLRVHAWVNVLSNAGQRQSPPVRELGRAAVQVDRQGRSLLDYPDLEVPEPDRRYYRMGTPAVWLDPAVPGVADHLVATFAGLAARYPGLDGIHLDYVRYPDVLPFTPGSRFGVGLEFGFGEVARQRFQAETGLEAPFASSPGSPDRFDAWRREQVSGLVSRIRAAARAARPGLELSAAVWAWPDRAYLSMFQDWRGWLEDGLLDFAVAMLYTRDDRLLHYNTRAFTGGVGGERVWIGLGAWLFARQPAGVVAQLRDVAEVGPSGVALFSWDALADAPALRDAVVAELARGG